MIKVLLPQGYQNVERLHEQLEHEPEPEWMQRGEQRALKLFHDMARRVPAYKDFLSLHKFSPSSVRTIADFARIPPINKDNYLRAYPKEMLCWDGEFPRGQWVISSTSGSSGQPYYFPREHAQDCQYAITAELYLRSNFMIQKRTTLYIVAFPMGAWIGGLFTYEALKIVASRGGYNLSIVTPGINKQEVINAVKQLGKSFDQIIIGAYAPFLKDILDDGERQGLDWSEYALGFVFSAEAFSETFRDYVIRKVGLKEPLRATLNHYGTVDLGTMAHETPETIMIRRNLVSHNNLATLFPESLREPTFAQYNPELFYFEEVNNNLLCSAYSGIPLVRYDLKDYGGVLSREAAHQQLAESGFNVLAGARKAAIDDTLWNLPFVYIYERNDFSVSYYAFLLYPDSIRRSLEQSKYINELTGKFTMLVEYDKVGRQHLIVNAEMKHSVVESGELKNMATDDIHARLMRESSEYKETFNTIGKEIIPIIKLWQYEDPQYFRAGSKQKWVVK